MIINRKYLRQLIESVISEQELSPQDIEKASRSDKDLIKALDPNVKIKVIGNISSFPKKLKNKISRVEKLTKDNHKIQINMALNYGSRQEIIRSFKIMKKKKLSINLKNFEKNLYTNNIPDPDILIRTGNTKRISNFLIWQIIYTEIFFEKKMWPDFNEKDFFRILKKFKLVRRNFGGIDGRIK